METLGKHVGHERGHGETEGHAPLHVELAFPLEPINILAITYLLCGITVMAGMLSPF
jgi:hypothetical protein